MTWVDVKLGQGGAGTEAWPVQLADENGTVVEYLNEIPVESASGLPVRLVGGVGRVSANNRSTVPLNAAATFTGISELNNFPTVLITCISDQDGTLYADFGPDGTNWDSTLTFSTNAGLQETHRLTKGARYFRVRFTNNSSSNQTYLRLNSYFGDLPVLTSALNSTIREDADAQIVRSIESELDIAAGRFQGYEIVNKFGTNGDIDSGSVPEDIWEGGGVYTGFPSTAETLRAVSSNTNDTLGGTGAEKIRVQAMTTSYEWVAVTFTLSGTTPVAPDSPYTSTTFLRVHTGTVIQSANGANTSFNAGVITVRHTTTTANVFLTIQIGRNQSNCAAYTIPAGYTGYMRFLHVAIRGTGQLAQSQAVEGAIYVRAIGMPPRTRRPFIVTTNYRLTDNIYGGLVFNEKTDINLRITTASANDISVNGGYDLLLVKNI